MDFFRSHTAFRHLAGKTPLSRAIGMVYRIDDRDYSQLALNGILQLNALAAPGWEPSTGDGVLMKDFALILIGTTLVHNFVLVKFLGVCPFVGASRRVETAVGMALATTFVLTLTGALAWVVEAYLLAPLGIEYLRIIAFLLVIAGVAQLAERVMAEASPVLYQLLGIFLPLITINCAVLGVALLNQQEKRTFLESTLYGFGAGLGFSLVLILFAAIRERVDVADVPAPFQGAAITFITLGLMSLAFMGFAGRAPS